MRSGRLDGHTTLVRGVPITSAERTVIDLAGSRHDRDLARVVREAIRLRCTTVRRLYLAAVQHPGRRGVARLKAILGRYAGLPLARTRSDAEADFHWRPYRLIIEIDGGRFHLDAAEDARKQRAWERAGWTVRRVPAEDVYEAPHRLLALAPPAERR